MKSIDEDKRLQITVGCVPFFLGYNKHKKFKKIHNQLIDRFGSQYDTEAWLMITCISKALKKGVVFSKFTLNRNNYSENNKTYGLKLSHTKTVKLLKLLESANYLQVYTGYWSTKKAETTVVEFLPEFTDMFGELSLDKLVITPDKSSVEIRDITSKVPLSNKGFTGISLLKGEVDKYNTLLSSTNIRLLGNICNVNYRRIFIKNLKGSGRWYSGAFQTIKSKYRQYITFDGEVTTEIDIKAIHPSIHACNLGIQLPPEHDPYKCDVNLEGDPVEIRTLCKQGLLCILYANNNKSAKLALANHFKEDSALAYEDRSYKTITKYRGIFADIVNSLIKANYMISSKFFKKDGWLSMQYTDSQICRYVINSFVAQNKPILSYHDSLICSKSDKALLIEVMHSAWEEVLGTKDNLRLEVKF